MGPCPKRNMHITTIPMPTGTTTIIRTDPQSAV